MADLATKRLLIWSVFFICIMAHAAFLRGIGAVDPACLPASFGGVPGDLLGDVCQIRSTHIGVHGACLLFHRGNRKLFIGKPCPRMFSKAFIYCSVDLLTHMSDKALPA